MTIYFSPARADSRFRQLPPSPNAYDPMGDYYATRAGRWAQAIANYQEPYR